jgi:succinate-acetate transporter protein
MAGENKLANPAVLGLTCFGMTTVLLNFHNAGLFKLDAPVLAMGIFLGGTVQIIAGILEFRKGNSFGMTAFCAYGAFWLTLSFILIGKPFLLKPLAMEASAKGLAWYLLLWGIFSCFMFIGTFKVNRVLQTVFFTLIILFGLLTIHFAWFTSPGSSMTVLKTAGVVGIVCGGSAIYLAMAELINEMYGRIVFPIGAAEVVTYKNPEDL